MGVINIKAVRHNIWAGESLPGLESSWFLIPKHIISNFLSYQAGDIAKNFEICNLGAQPANAQSCISKQATAYIRNVGMVIFGQNKFKLRGYKTYKNFT